MRNAPLSCMVMATNTNHESKSSNTYSVFSMRIVQIHYFGIKRDALFRNPITLGLRLQKYTLF